MVIFLDKKHAVGEYNFPWGCYVPASTATQRHFKADMRGVNKGRLANWIIEMYTHSFWVKPGVLSAVQGDRGKL